jgi:ElaB/YqjD/DUF883 family membrane-anchored ribosome-binding protein
MNDEVTPGKLYDHLQDLIRDADALLKATATYAGDKVDKARAQAEHSVRAAKERLGDLKDDAVGRTSEFVSQGHRYVRGNPWQSIGIAALIGFVVGAAVLGLSSSSDEDD